MPTVSIIVPVYNAEKTLSRCVDSILNQTYQDLEVLLVDDGSSESSGALCDQYAARDSRVKVFHQKNSGVSASRNLALDNARGIYLQFLDSDDWITPDATACLVKAAEETGCDLVIADFYRVIGERVSHKGDIDEDTVLTREEYAAHMMENPADFYYGVLWNKLYRRSLVEARRLRMNTAISWCEDFMFNLEYIRHAQTFYALQVPIYYYVKTKGSLVSTQGTSISKTVRMKLMVFEYYQQFFKSVLDEEEYEKSRMKVYHFLIDAAGDGMVLPALLPGSTRLGKERQQVWPELVDGEGTVHDLYRQRKLLDRYLETVALKHDLTLKETRLLLYVQQAGMPIYRRALADFISLPYSTTSILLKRLSTRGLITLEDGRDAETGNRWVRVTFPFEASLLLSDLSAALTDYRQTLTRGMTEDEMAQYDALSKKVQQNIRTLL